MIWVAAPAPTTTSAREPRSVATSKGGEACIPWRADTQAETSTTRTKSRKQHCLVKVCDK